MNKIKTSLAVALIVVAVFGVMFAYIAHPVKADVESEIDMLRCRADQNDDGRVNSLDLVRIVRAMQEEYSISFDLNRDEKIDYGDLNIAQAFWDERPTNCPQDNEKLGANDWVTAAMTCRMSINHDSVINAEDVFLVGLNGVDIDKSGAVNKDDAFLVRGYEYSSTLHC